MSHRVDAGVQRMQAPTRNSVLNRVVAQPELRQLVPGYDPVLPPRQRRDPGVPPWLPRLLSPRPWKYAYTTIFHGLGGHGRRLTGNIARVVRGLCQMRDESVPDPQLLSLGPCVSLPRRLRNPRPEVHRSPQLRDGLMGRDTHGPLPTTLRDGPLREGHTWPLPHNL